MNQFTLLVLFLVVFCYCGGKYCPSVLKQNKEILLGVVGGLVLASFFGFKLEGADTPIGGTVGAQVAGGGHLSSSGSASSGTQQINIECQQREKYCGTDIPAAQRTMWESMCDQTCNPGGF